jgi:hypothetical protein
MARKSEVSSSMSAATTKAITGKVAQIVRKRTKAAAPELSKATKPVVTESISVRSRQDAIALEAWLLAERRGFSGGNPVTDWLEAEKKIDDRLAAAHGHRTAA